MNQTAYIGGGFEASVKKGSRPTKQQILGRDQGGKKGKLKNPAPRSKEGGKRIRVERTVLETAPLSVQRNFGEDEEAKERERVIQAVQKPVGGPGCRTGGAEQRGPGGGSWTTPGRRVAEGVAGAALSGVGGTVRGEGGGEHCAGGGKWG